MPPKPWDLSVTEMPLSHQRPVCYAADTASESDSRGVEPSQVVMVHMVIHPCKIVSHLTAGLRTAASFCFSSLTYFPSCDALLKWLWAFLVSGVEGKLRWGHMYIMFSGLLSCGLQSCISASGFQEYLYLIVNSQFFIFFPLGTPQLRKAPSPQNLLFSSWPPVLSSLSWVCL